MASFHLDTSKQPVHFFSFELNTKKEEKDKEEEDKGGGRGEREGKERENKRPGEPRRVYKCTWSLPLI